jgi:hypothetical protein
MEVERQSDKVDSHGEDASLNGVLGSIILYDTSGLKPSLDAGLGPVPFSIALIDRDGRTIPSQTSKSSYL